MTEPEPQVTKSGERQGLPVGLLEEVEQQEVMGRICLVSATKSEDDVTKARKESFIKNKTKHSKPLSRI